MLKFIFKRLLEALPTLFILITFSFFLMRLAPGSPFTSERAYPPEVMANNLDEPVSFVNRLLEGEPKKAFVHFNRFWINSTFGIGGLFDFASASKELQVYDQRSFGETLGTYGVDAGAYIVLPIYNATTPRQLTGAVVDAAYTYPFWNWVGGPWSLVKYGVQAVDKRSKTLYQTELLNQAQDPYVTFREAYYQNLEFKVNDGKVKEGSQKELSDDVLKEID